MRFFLFISLLACSYALKVDIQNTPSIDGYDFDNITYGKDIMCLFWDHQDIESKKFKMAQWDMLNSQKEIYVRSSYLMVANVNCRDIMSQEFCQKFIAVNITKYPTIIYSHNNEPFKKYNGSYDYPSITDFAFRYFERSCVFNQAYCKNDREKEEVAMWLNTTHDMLKRLIYRENENAEQMIRNFEVYKMKLTMEHSKDQEDTTTGIINEAGMAELMHESFEDRREKRYVEFSKQLWNTQEKIDEFDKRISMMKDILKHFPDLHERRKLPELEVPQKKDVEFHIDLK